MRGLYIRHNSMIEWILRKLRYVELSTLQKNFYESKKYYRNVCCKLDFFTALLTLGIAKLLIEKNSYVGPTFVLEIS